MVVFDTQVEDTAKVFSLSDDAQGLSGISVRDLHRSMAILFAEEVHDGEGP
jgi:uncharacterized small protein (DUF1192 family)